MAEQSLIYQVAVGEVPAFYRTCIESVARYCARHGIRHIVQTEPVLKIRPVKSHRSVNALRLGYLPIFEKENALAYLCAYRHVAEIGADVYVRDAAPNLFDVLREEDEFAAVLERDMPLTQKYREKIIAHSEGQFRPLTDVDWHWEADGAARNLAPLASSATAENRFRRASKIIARGQAACEKRRRRAGTSCPTAPAGLAAGWVGDARGGLVSSDTPPRANEAPLTSP